MRLVDWLVAATLTLLPALAHAEPAFTPEQFRSHVTFLADDLLEGRDAGTRGYDLSALYVATQFAGLGLQPAVKGKWYQDVPLFRPNGKSAGTSANVIGVLPGSDPKLAGEYVLMTAHLDHVGTDAEGKGDRIHNGALDNATGIAALIEVARAMKAAGTAPRRSILFAAVTAEEDGLIGSHYLARHPVTGSDRIVAVVNADMPVLLYDFTDVIAYGAERSTLGEVAARAVGDMGLSLAHDPMKQEDFFLRSDHFSFVQRGIPALFLMTGFAGEGEARFRRFIERDYHQPSDDLDLPINWQAGAKFARLNYHILRDVADADTAPEWYEGDELGNRFASRQRKAPRPAP